MHRTRWRGPMISIVRYNVGETQNEITLYSHLRPFHNCFYGRWVWRKERQIDDDINIHPEGIFVAEIDNRVVG